MATKVERTVLLPESVYNRIVRIAKEEHSNIPWVTRQLLAKAMADLKGKPEWFYEIEEQIAGLRNETIVVERAKRVERTALHLDGTEEQLLVELKKQIEEVRKEIGEVREETRARLKEQKPKERIGNRFATRHLLVNALAEERTGSDRPDRFEEIQRDLEWLRSEVQAAQKQSEKQEQTGEQLYSELKKQIAELKDALAVKPEPLEKLELEEKDNWNRREIRQRLWGKSPDLEDEQAESYNDIIDGIWGKPLELDAEESEEREPEDRPTTAAYLLWGKSPDLEGEQEPEPTKEPEPEQVEEVASIQPAAKGKVLRPFFGRLSQMFSSVLS